MSYLSYEILIKIITKNHREISHTLNLSGYRDFSKERDGLVDIIINPYKLCLCKSIDDMVEMFCNGFIYWMYSYEYKKSKSYFDDDSEFIKNLYTIESVDDIKSIEFYGYKPDDKNAGRHFHKFDIENMTYEYENTLGKIRINDFEVDFFGINPSIEYSSGESFRYESFFGFEYISLPYIKMNSVFYDCKHKCIVCPNCLSKIDKDICVIDRKSRNVYCDEYCTFDSEYKALRNAFKHEKSVSVTYELLHTNEPDRVALIENLKSGTKLKLRPLKNDVVSFIAPDDSIIGDTTSSVQGNNIIVALACLKKTDPNVVWEATVTKVVPKSQRPKKAMKPIVEVTFTIDMLFN